MALRKYEKITNFKEAKHFWENNNNKKIANNTFLLKEGDNFIVTYHRNTIIRYFENGEISLFNAGWYTSTTKERLNIFTPNYVEVYQRKGVWYLHETMSEKKNFMKE